MDKRKIFTKTDVSTSVAKYIGAANEAVAITVDVIPPLQTIVIFEHGVHRSHSQARFDFRRWYGKGIDSITYSCQQQIERFLDRLDREVTNATIRAYCNSLITFLTYLIQISIALRRNLTLADINRENIDGYLISLRDSGVSTISQKSRYSNIKAVLKALIRRGLILEIIGGDDSTFPRNPFPATPRLNRGEKPLSKSQRQAFTAAVKTAVMPIFSDDVPVTSELLTYALLTIALHTGRNTWPLLEMSRDCLHPHPKEDRVFLVLYKRRGYSTNKVALRTDENQDVGIQSMPGIKPNVSRLVKRVLELSDRLRDEAPSYFKDRVWLFRMRTTRTNKDLTGRISALNTGTLQRCIRLLVKRFGLIETDGSPLQINVSRLRKTFVNRIYEILEGDVISTAAAASHSPAVSDNNYLRPGEDAHRNWKFLGAALVTELLSDNIGATERTPVGHCSDPLYGHYAPKRDRVTCTSFFNCLRCRNYVVTSNDLYRLFSFYWRIYAERAHMSEKKWHKEYAHIVRLIEQDVIEAGLTKGIFQITFVKNERERARINPHPFWRSDTIVTDLVELS